MEVFGAEYLLFWTELNIILFENEIKEVEPSIY